jgi:hypothetical protein
MQGMKEEFDKDIEILSQNTGNNKLKSNKKLR